MTFIIAEMSGNTGGSIDKAKEMIMAAKWAGCHAVKFQLYRKEDLPNTYDPKLHVEMLPMMSEIFACCYKQNLPLVLSVFAWWATDFLVDSSVHAIKFASPESTQLAPDSYRRMARLIKENKKPLWVSSGNRDWPFMATLNPDLHFYCPPGHPAILDEQNLLTVRGRGFSDHTVGIIQTLAAVKAGASHIEKHFMLDTNCVDAEFSINPDQMKLLCDLCS